MCSWSDVSTLGFWALRPVGLTLVAITRRVGVFVSRNPGVQALLAWEGGRTFLGVEGLWRPGEEVPPTVPVSPRGTWHQGSNEGGLILPGSSLPFPTLPSVFASQCQKKSIRLSLALTIMFIFLLFITGKPGNCCKSTKNCLTHTPNPHHCKPHPYYTAWYVFMYLPRINNQHVI